ncbi:MAG: division/cell wall cluster transcriptional repressor MraZ [Bacteroidales bacterium]
MSSNKRKIRFSSRYQALVDDKGRFVLPSAYKKQMGELALEPLVITMDPYKKCLHIYPKDYWEDELDRMEEMLDVDVPEQADFLEELYERFVEVTMAANGRLSIPVEYREYAGLKKEVLLSGVKNMIVLWDKGTYEKHSAEVRTEQFGARKERFLRAYKEQGRDEKK